jgi:hypothetical protein
MKNLDILFFCENQSRKKKCCSLFWIFFFFQKRDKNMQLRSDIVFHDIVIDICRNDIELTLPEWALYRRTMTDLFNPRGPLWAFAGMTLWRKIFPRTVISPIIVGLYCWEASWSFHDKYPVATFFRDISLMDPAENKLACKIRNEFPRIDGMNWIGDRRGWMHRFSDFVRLKRTRLMLFGTKSSKQLHRETGVGTITCDFGPKPQKSPDIDFVLGSHTSIGKLGYPILRGLAETKNPHRKEAGHQPTIQDFSTPPPSPAASSNTTKSPVSSPPPTSTNNETIESGAFIDGCAEISIPPSLDDARASSESTIASQDPKTLTQTQIEKLKRLAKRRADVLRRLRGAQPTAKSATTPQERHINCIRDVPLKTVWGYHATDDFIANSDILLGWMWFLIQASAAWDVGWIIGDENANGDETAAKK